MTDKSNAPEVVVVGAGPAGIAAATMLLSQGARVTLIDEMPEVGGQYYKQRLAARDLSRGRDLDERIEKSQDRLSALHGERFTALTGTLVWGMFAPHQVAILRGEEADILKPDAVILAGGAMERAAAFPGWTLPGVVMAGGVQTLLGREGILPGRRFLVAGTGPLLLAVAAEIAEAGGQVVGVVEGSQATAPLRHLHHFWGQMRRVKEAWDYRRILDRHDIPMHNGHIVVAARGDGRVEEVTFAQVDPEWQVLPDTERTVAVDALCLHFGFEALTEIARMVECDIAQDPDRGGWHVTHDDGMRTSNPSIYVAGQIAGIGGADLAESTGAMAGLSAARDLGLLGERAYTAQAGPLQREIAQRRDIARVLNTIYSPGPALPDLVMPDTVICRCEEVTAGAIDAALAEGTVSINDIKRRTRCGMGMCQSRICSPIVRAYVERKVGATAEEVGLITARPPLRPIPLGALADLAEEHIGDVLTAGDE
ncbi:MAG: NAD(P)/FAD-dependent oxidoreductase [Thermomicrobiales bacterium]|nr:NAD(P)/FAD-dependent oxidoreductase [Thermomicrobiales bacterium]